MDPARSLRSSDEFVRRFAAALRGQQLYAATHPLVDRAMAALAESTSQMLADQPSVTIGIVGQEIVVGSLPIPRAAESFAEMIRRLKSLGIERIAIDRGVTPEELTTLTQTIAHPERRAGQAAPGVDAADPLAVLSGLPHVRVGRINVDDRIDSSAADMATMRKLYSDATGIAEAVWDAAKSEGLPDPQQARALIDSLAQAVSQNRTALIALTALKDYDNYTFTHMVNVSILTMAQARALGVDGTLLRELGLAALMHDIGKVRTPTDILNKPSSLTADEFVIMRKHVVDGAEILRRTPEMPAIAPVVAFEHHLRQNGTGYPYDVSRGGLNLGTILCSIADVYDAMRSERAYQKALPTDRILGVLKGNDSLHFDRYLVRRFTQLLGIYPPGNLVRLDTGALAVVVAVHAPDPYRPRVRVIADSAGARLERPVDVNLWEAIPDGPGPRSVLAPLNPAEHAIDPLTYL